LAPRDRLDPEGWKDSAIRSLCCNRKSLATAGFCPVSLSMPEAGDSLLVIGVERAHGGDAAQGRAGNDRIHDATPVRTADVFVCESSDFVAKVPSMSELDVENELLTADRRGASRRTGADRRSASEEATTTYTGEERRVGPRRKVERRRQIDPTTCEREYTDDEIEFMRAMDDYKRRAGRQFPTWSEVLEVLKSMGYKRD
jgi:hypothetical protein